MYLQTLNASDVRKYFSEFIDTVVRKQPVVFKRNRDHVLSISIEQANMLLANYKFTMRTISEEDGTVTATLDDFDLVVNAENVALAKTELANELIEYSQEYIENFPLYQSSPNRQKHFPYIMKVILANDYQEVENFINA